MTTPKSTPSHFIHFVFGEGGAKLGDAFEGWIVSRELKAGEQPLDASQERAAYEAFIAGVGYAAEQMPLFRPSTETGDWL